MIRDLVASLGAWTLGLVCVVSSVNGSRAQGPTGSTSNSPSADAVPAEISYRNHIQPLFKEKCATCHGSDSPYYGDFKENRDEYVAQDLGPRMDTYADLIYFIGWPDTGAIMRRLDDGKHSSDGKAGNMYEYLGEDEAERQRNLELFKAWIGPDAWKLNRWNARGDVPAITKEDLDRLQLKY